MHIIMSWEVSKYNSNQKQVQFQSTGSVSLMPCEACLEQSQSNKLVKIYFFSTQDKSTSQ